MTRLSRSFKAERGDERIEIIDDALIEAIELRPLLLVDPSICSKGAENLSITHNFGSDSGSQRDVGQAR